MKRLIITIGILIIIVCLLAIYIAILQSQFRSINRQLVKRITGNTRNPVSLELINHELNKLTANINKCLKAEETLRQESVQKEKRFKELIANISHDLRTPLTAIKGYQQLIAKGELTPDQHKKLKIAQKHADELGRLIEHFFEFSYLVNSELKPNLKPTNLTNLVTECLASFVPSFEQRGLMVQFMDGPPVYALADHEMIVRIVQNLIRNCLAHSAGGVVVVVLSTSENAIISFRNPVKNASEIDIKCIFDRFYTGDRARSTTGLGLSIVKLLTEQMGGIVRANLHENELTLQVEVPLCN